MEKISFQKVWLFLLFAQDISHEGSILNPAGRKYVMRTNVMYKNRRGIGNEYSSYLGGELYNEEGSCGMEV